MPIHIYNSLTKKSEPISSPQEKKIIKMYSCGVTVYDACHIGHARSVFVFDVIKRYLKFRGYDVHFVRNITDVDDKIINRAKETGKTSEQVALENIELYRRDLKSLDIDEADKEPRATENIPDVVAYTGKLIAKGFAYESGGSVYYDVRKFKEYGKLSGQSIEKMLEAVRIDPNEQKKDPLDFALWKKSQDDEPGWPSPWGRGRPGWHIECTCMSLKHLDCETLDIHAGGRDLIFPHHENEIAQAEPVTGKPFAKVWIHHGLLTINGQKMSKSLGNFVTIQDAVKRYRVDEIKFFFLLSHYASPIDFSDEKVKEAKQALQRFIILGEKIKQLREKQPVQISKTMSGWLQVHYDNFIQAMDNDFNTARAVGVLFELLNEMNKRMVGTFDLNEMVQAHETILSLSRTIFGLFREEQTDHLSSDEEGLLQQRIEARKNKDFKLSDTLRDELKKRNIIVEDSKAGQTWRRG
jgi:cysteinyl-tRNA synthetase